MLQIEIVLETSIICNEKLTFYDVFTLYSHLSKKWNQELSPLMYIN